MTTHEIQHVTMYVYSVSPWQHSYSYI